jgi:nitrate reductase (cytochrome), electron transfer subunit
MMNGLVRTLVVTMAAGAIAAASTALLAETLSALRPVPLDQIAPAPRMTPLENSSERQMRNYPEQPPIIPHTTEGYEISLNSNRCLSCHARSRTGESRAPMVSITHFMDRDGQFLATISPRRYFCEQCHVPQHTAKAPVENTFVDVDTVIERSLAGERRR